MARSDFRDQSEKKEEKLIREIRKKDLLRYYVLTFFGLALLVCFLVAVLTMAGYPMKLILSLATVVPGYFLLKYHAIGCVLMYKAFAPLEVRDRCRFEPTCSTYMILAIKKYGLFIGAFKGLRRIARCKPPNSGIDYP